MGSEMNNIIVLLLMLLDYVVSRRIAVEPAFFDTTPNDYSKRLTLRDCADRFYTNIEKYNGPYGALGGLRVFPGEFQHMAAIGWTRAKGRIDYLCGGSLISKDFVLTAAHCVVDLNNIPPDTVRLGDTDLGSPESNKYAQQIGIARFTTHPQYRAIRNYFDIALIQLETPHKESDFICSACLWLEEEPPRERMDAIGFGATEFAGALSHTLQRVELVPIDLNECGRKIRISKRQMPDGFHNDQFCAAGNGMDTCGGDSGGPIGVKRVDVGGLVIPLVVGVVSFGTPCTPASSGVYTKVSPYLDWIEQETKRSFSYEACTRSTFCPGQNRTSIPVNFGVNYAQNRFGLLWDDSDISALYECGATLIDYQYLMTLASCVTSSRGHPKYVAHDDGARVAVTDIYVSPKYTGRPENNIALLKIAKFVNTNVYRPACLWNRHIDGDWEVHARFSAYGPVLQPDQSLTLKNNSIFIAGYDKIRCDSIQPSRSDMLCYRNNISIMPGVCAMDYGAPVMKASTWEGPVFAYGLVSTMSKDCGSNLFVNDVTPHIEWIESIVSRNLEQILIFSD